MRVYLLIFSFLIVGFTRPGLAGLDHVGTSAANFLKIGVGAQAVAMGDAYTAIASDPTAMFWNPGGLGFQNRMAANFSYTDWILDTQLGYLGFVLPLGPGSGVVGLSINSFSSGDIEETTIYKPHGTGRVFDASDLTIGLSYARKLTDRFSFGITAKYINEKLALESATAFAVDVGSIFILNYDYNVRMGLVISNFGSNMQLDGLDLETSVSTENSKQVEAQLKTYSWPLPLIFRLGLAADLISTVNHRFTVAADVYDPRDYKARENIGMEYAFKSLFFLRGGYKMGYDEEGLTAGFGIHYGITGVGKLLIDYAFADMGRLNSINRFSIGLSF